MDSRSACSRRRCAASRRRRSRSRWLGWPRFKGRRRRRYRRRYRRTPCRLCSSILRDPWAPSMYEERMAGLFDLTGKTAAVIGAGSGIGEAVALACARQGAFVACLDINADAARGVASRAHADGGKAEAGPLDIRDSAAVEASFADVQKRGGTLDVVICTPAINVRKPILKYTDEEFARVLDLNMRGNFNVLRAAGRIMTAQKTGSIILFSSIRAQAVEPGQAVYAATKAAIVQMVRTAAAEFGPSGVRVNAIGPGVIDTP